MSLTWSNIFSVSNTLWGFSKLHIDWLAYLFGLLIGCFTLTSGVGIFLSSAYTSRLLKSDVWFSIPKMSITIVFYYGLPMYSLSINTFPIYPCICYRITATPLLFWTLYNRAIYRLSRTDKDDITPSQYELFMSILSFYPLVVKWF